LVANIDLLPSQDDFVFSPYPFPLIKGGLGSGKTRAGTFRTVIQSLQDMEANLAYYMPSYDLLELRAKPGIMEDLELCNIPYKELKSRNIIKVEGRGDIIFRSYDRPERIVAYEVAHSVVDELDTIPFEKASYVWRKITERNRQETAYMRANNIRNSLGCVTTPDNGVNGFVYDKWVKKKQKGYEIYTASTYDNPFLPDDYIQNILNNYDPIMADLYLKGEFVSLNTNKIYHFFSRKKHHTNRVLTPNDKFIYIGQDFNIGGCTSSVWIIEKNIPIMVDELISHDTYDLINNLKNRYYGKTIEICPDASGNQGSTNATQSDIALLRAAGFSINAPLSNPAVRDRINSVNGLQAHDMFLINTDKCPEHTHALENQGYDIKGQPEKWNEHPAIDDFNDDMGYFINRKFGLTKPVVSSYNERMV